MSAELDDPRKPGLFWCVNPEVIDLDYGGDEEPVYVRNPDEVACFARVNRFPPAVLLTGSETPDGRRLCFPSESDVRDED